jgi:SSS family solute:Na+ symporter
VNVHFVLILAYAAGLTALGVWIGRRVQTPADFFVANRRLGWPLILATVLSANIGAGATVGATGLAYRDGVSAWWWNGSAGLGSLLLAFFIGPKIWRLAADRGYLTAGDFLEDRYSSTVRGLAAVIIWIGTLFLLAGQLIAGAAVLQVVADIPRWMGVLIGGIAMTAYFTAGGLLSSAWVNAVQLVVKFVGFTIAVPVVLTLVGGVDGIAATAGLHAGYWDPLYSAGAMSGFTMLLLLGPNFVVSPGLVQKTYGASGERAVRLGIGLNAVLLMVFAFIPMLLGMAARAAHPDIVGRDLVLPTLLLHDLPVWLGALALAAVFSAEVSTCDAILFMLATSLSKDLYKRFVDPGATPDRVLLVARLAAVAGGLAGMTLALQLATVLDALSIFYSVIGATLFVPVVAGLYTRRVGPAAAIVSIVCGLLGLVAVFFGTTRAGWWNPNLWGLVASAIGFTIVAMAPGTEGQGFSPGQRGRG